MSKPLVMIAAIVGIILFILAILYFIEPAKSLPAFIPGHDMSMKHHYKHGVGALLLSLGVFAFAWFKSGKKSSH